jgi:hypothetical protein
VGQEDWPEVWLSTGFYGIEKSSLELEFFDQNVNTRITRIIQDHYKKIRSTIPIPNDNSLKI